MELIKLSGLNSCNSNHWRFSDIFASFSHEGTCKEQVLGFLTWETHLSRSEPALGPKSSMAKLAKCGIPLQTACRNSKGQNGVTVTSKKPATHGVIIHSHMHTRRCSHNDAPHYFPWLNCMAGSFLTESRAVCLGKVQLPQLRRSGTLPPFTSLPARPLLSLSLSCSLSLTHSLHNVWLTAQHVRAGEHTWLTVHSRQYIRLEPLGVFWFFWLHLFKVGHHFQSL